MQISNSISIATSNPKRITLLYNIGEEIYFTYPAVDIKCNTFTVAYEFINDYGPYENGFILEEALNLDPNTSSFGLYSYIESTNSMKLEISASLVQSLCNRGVISFEITSNL